MKIIVVSDTHGAHSRLNRVLKMHDDADVFVHLGDGVSEFKREQDSFKSQKFICVAGNCDRAINLNTSAVKKLGDVTLFLTHGHKYDVKSNLDQLLKAAKDKGANVILYGHTHKKFTKYIDGTFILNPGSLGLPKDGNPSFGIVDITKAGIVLNTVEVSF